MNSLFRGDAGTEGPPWSSLRGASATKQSTHLSKLDCFASLAMTDGPHQLQIIMLYLMIPSPMMPTMIR
jgi:hypothetical protein